MYEYPLTTKNQKYLKRNTPKKVLHSSCDGIFECSRGHPPASILKRIVFILGSSAYFTTKLSTIFSLVLTKVLPLANKQSQKHTENKKPSKKDLLVFSSRDSAFELYRHGISLLPEKDGSWFRLISVSSQPVLPPCSLIGVEKKRLH